MNANNFNGPFRISGDTDGWSALHDGIGCSEYRAIKDADDFVVALVVDHNEDHRAQLDTKKCADLFAAAPDLLAACQNALDMLSTERQAFVDCNRLPRDDVRTDDPVPHGLVLVEEDVWIRHDDAQVLHDYDRAIGLIEDAIAKATGAAA